MDPWQWLWRFHKRLFWNPFTSVFWSFLFEAWNFVKPWWIDKLLIRYFYLERKVSQSFLKWWRHIYPRGNESCGSQYWESKEGRRGSRQYFWSALTNSGCWFYFRLSRFSLWWLGNAWKGHTSFWLDRGDQTGRKSLTAKRNDSRWLNLSWVHGIYQLEKFWSKHYLRSCDSFRFWSCLGITNLWFDFHYLWFHRGATIHWGINGRCLWFDLGLTILVAC